MYYPYTADVAVSSYFDFNPLYVKNRFFAKPKFQMIKPVSNRPQGRNPDHY